jgi:hypothetical protein
MYSIVLVFHSWFRFIVLAFGLWLLVVCIRGLIRRDVWTTHAERTHVRFIGALDLQLLLGLLLYFVLSPVVAAARSDMGAAMHNSELRFFGMEHITMMLTAVVVAHAGRVVSKRKQGAARFRVALLTQGLWLLLTLVAIPWPGFAASRPLFRL